MSRSTGEILRRIPQVDDLVRREGVSGALDRAGRPLGLRLLRELLDEWRAGIRAGTVSAEELARLLEDLPAALDRRAGVVLAESLVQVVNATGVVVHTNLGRAVLCSAARAAMQRAAAGYSNLEYDLGAGERGSRGTHLSRPLAALFPEHDALAVNNNAGALLLALNTLASGAEVIVSRGELVEIGGSFRIPEIMERSGAVLCEVGTTNRTRAEDYRRAVTGATAVLLKVHPSNYRILGFTEETQLSELAEVAREASLPVVMDQGSGNLVDLSAHGIAEPPVARLLEEGADLVLFSGDKLLGGPQAGIAVGRRDLIEAMRKNPLARALRLDKVTAAALAATLGEYVRGVAMETVPVLRMVAASAAAVGERADRFAAELARRAGDAASVEVTDGGSVVGGGAWPLGELPTRLVTVRPARGDAGALEEGLRAGEPPVVARVEDGALRIDLRTVLPEEEAGLLDSLVRALAI